mgnify:CR=1 FL=1
MTRKNSTKIVPKKQSDPTLEPNGLKNSTKIVPKKQSDPTLEPNGLKNSTKIVPKSNPTPHWNLTDLKIARMRNHKKPIRIFSDLKNVTNAASQKTYPNFFGLEKCHECGITKNLSEFFWT